jgi:hypothetical protein
MAGIAAPGELTGAAATRFAVAMESDDAAIRGLLRNNPMRGAIDLTFEREPHYFRGVNLAGGVDQTIVAFRDSQLVCMGRCSRRECWVDGKARQAGYLAELRLDQSVRSQSRIVRDGYQFFHDLECDEPADVYFTSIAADNERARRFLEAGTRGMPRYRFLAELDTLLIAVPRRAARKQLRVDPATASDVPDMLRVLNDHGRRFRFAAVWTPERLGALAIHGLPLDRFVIARVGGEVAACAAIWDQRAFRQTVVRKYSPPLSIARPLINLGSRVLGRPGLPSPGSVLRHAFLSPLAFANDAEYLLPDFVEACFPAANEAGADYLTLALATADSRLVELRRRLMTRTWRSRLYQIVWPDRPAMKLQPQGAPFLPDVALL